MLPFGALRRIAECFGFAPRFAKGHKREENSDAEYGDEFSGEMCGRVAEFKEFSDVEKGVAEQVIAEEYPAHGDHGKGEYYAQYGWHF